MVDVERKDCLDRLGQLLVDARDTTLDEARHFLVPEGGGAIAGFVRGCYRQGGPDEQELCDMVGYYLDHLMIELAYKMQDAEIIYGLTLKVETSSQPSIPINQFSDGLAGEFLSADGWFAQKSRHGENRFASSDI